jgi:hypothetical protein
VGRVDEHAAALLAAVDAALEPWLVRCVTERMVAWSGSCPPEVAGEAAGAAAEGREEVTGRLTALLETDIDEQRSTPLAVVRSAVRWPTRVLAGAGVPPVERDEFAERSFPDDVYDLSPASFADVDEQLREPALVWGAAKAFEHKRRHRS